MYEEGPLEVIDPYITAHEEAFIEDFFNSKKSSAGTWTNTRQQWAFSFFGIAVFKKMCAFEYLTRDGSTYQEHSYFGGYVRYGQFEKGCTKFSRCCGFSEMTVDAIDVTAMLDKPKTLDVDALIPIWKNRLLYALVSRSAGAIATINKEQAPLLPALLELGFTIKSDWMYNPNSGHEIMLLFFQFPR